MSGAAPARGRLRPVLLALAAFLLILFAQFPAGWCRGLLPAGGSCRQLDGSLWSGRCAGLTLNGLVLGDAGWRLHPLALLRGRLEADINLARGGATLAGDVAVSLGGGHIEARGVEVRGLRLEQWPLPAMARGLAGLVQGRIEQLAVSGRRVRSLAGRLQAQGLAQQGTGPLGDYELSFAPAAAGADPVGVLHDTGGPLRVEGTLRLTPEPGFELAGRVAARAGAPAAFADQLRYLGSPDADGMRPFSVAGTF